MRYRQKKGGSIVFEKIKNFVDKILSFNIGNLFKLEMNNKIADKMQDNKLIELNQDNSQVMNKNYQIAIFQHIDCNGVIIESLSKGNENAQLLNTDIQKLLSDNEVSEKEIKQKLSNPEVLYTIAKANEIAYKTSDIDKRKILSDLIYKKMTTTIDSEESNVLSLAIQEMDILTINHIKALSFLYIIKSNYLKNYSENELITFYEQILSVLFEFKNSNAKIVGGFLASTRTLSAAHIGWNITSYLPQILTKNSTSHKETVRNEFIIWNTMWNDLGFMGAYITPIGEYIAKTYLFNNFGLLVEEVEEKNSTKDLSDDVSATELKETLEEANKNSLTWEEI